jgi:hypothetical protein
VLRVGCDLLRFHDAARISHVRLQYACGVGFEDWAKSLASIDPFADRKWCADMIRDFLEDTT